MALVVVIEGQNGIGLGGPPKFAWSNGDTGKYISGLCSGTYTVTATTEAGCTSKASFELCCLDLEVLELEHSQSDIPSGQFRIQVNSDSPVSEATVNGVGFTPGVLLTGLSSGVYEVVVETEGSCRLKRSVTINNCSDFISPIDSLVKIRRNGGPYYVEIDATSVHDDLDYQWSSGAVSPSIRARTDSTYQVTITNSSGCSVVHSYRFCEDGFGGSGTSSFIEDNESTTDVEFDLSWSFDYYNIPIATEIKSVEIYNTSGYPNFFILNGEPFEFSQSGTNLTVHEVPFGRRTLYIDFDEFCGFRASTMVRRCFERDEISINVMSDGMLLGGSSSPMIFAEIESNLDLDDPLYSSLLYNLENESGEIISQSDSPLFTILEDGPYTIVAIDECGSRWEGEFLKVASCGEGTVNLDVRDACNTGINLSRPWFRVEAFTARQNLMHSGDTVHVSIKFHQTNGDVIPFYGGDGYIGGIQNQLGGMARYSLNHPDYRYTIGTDQVGYVEVIVTAISGCQFFEKVVFRKRPIKFPYVATIFDSEQTEGFIISSDNTVSTGPYWFGYGTCRKSCFDERFFDNTSRTIWNRTMCVAERQFEPILFKYIPRNKSAPCRLGGTLTLPGNLFGINSFDGDQEINVQPNANSRLFKGKGRCGCVFPPEAVEYSLGPPSKVPVYAEFDCGELSPDDSDVLVEIPKELIDSLCRANRCDSCIVEVVDCRADLICLETTDPVVFDIHHLWAEDEGRCYVITQDEVNEDGERIISLIKGTPCATDPCSVDNFEVAPGDIIRDLFYNEMDFRLAVGDLEACVSTEVCNFSDWPKRLRAKYDINREFSPWNYMPNNNNIMLYPNPVSVEKSQDINFRSKIPYKYCIAYDVNGRRFEGTIDGHIVGFSRNLSAGMYFLKFISDFGESSITKLVVI